ncbi:hypothetical protein CspHIS471_0400890 [Cutaneotrichosporon sp. HIS471]|nr:hypothetical protein CspHIS471_0400890 [Cutaneotrichosporon sp. HIS471]
MSTTQRVTRAAARRIAVREVSQPTPISTSSSTPQTTPISTAKSATAPTTRDVGMPMSPLAPISPWPPEEPSAPYPDLPVAKEVYGLLAVLLTYLAFGAYLVWAFAPSHWLDAVGWTWYPSREWAIIVPCWLMMVVLLTYWSYTALTAFLIPAFQSPSIITDERSNMPPEVPGAAPYYWKFAEADAVPEAVDLPIDLANRVLYPPRTRTRPRS